MNDSGGTAMTCEEFLFGGDVNAVMCCCNKFESRKIKNRRKAGFEVNCSLVVAL